MALQLGALRDALIDAGASEEKAQRAAEELAGYQSEFGRLRDDMRDGFGKVEQQFAKVDQEFALVRGDINLLRWMAGTNLVLTVVVLGSLFALWSKVGELGGQLAQITRAVSH
jgi:hypothetical protein